MELPLFSARWSTDAIVGDAHMPPGHFLVGQSATCEILDRQETNKWTCFRGLPTKCRRPRRTAGTNQVAADGRDVRRENRSAVTNHRGHLRNAVQPAGDVRQRPRHLGA
jgi:hypothetical protein